MCEYHEASKIVKPKMDQLAIQNSRLDAAQSELAEQEEMLRQVQEKLAGLQGLLDTQLAEKNAL